jgi:hypothetical protein
MVSHQIHHLKQLEYRLADGRVGQVGQVSRLGRTDAYKKRGWANPTPVVLPTAPTRARRLRPARTELKPDPVDALFRDACRRVGRRLSSVVWGALDGTITRVRNPPG